MVKSSTMTRKIRCTGLSENELYQFRLITQNGQTVFAKTIFGNGSLVIPQNLSAGSYILMITGSNRINVSGKVTVL